LGSADTGGRRAPLINQDFVVDLEGGVLTQVGRLAGTWGSAPAALISYTWLEELHVVTTTGAGVLSSTDVELTVNEVALWAPDAQVDRFNLFNNYGHLINRFEPSTEQYREFIRGVFQLYVLGPTLERIESALNVIARFPVIRDDDEVLTDFDTSDPTLQVVVTRRPNGDTVRYEFPASLTMRDDVQDSANFEILTFESFEPLSLAFIVSDSVQDPAWWTDIIIPGELMPNESLGRRRTIPVMIDNIVDPPDLARIGDPGFFVGADDEGIIPPYIATSPAKRRKMANVVMERFLQHNIFFVRFDQTLNTVLSPSFLSDLTALILVAKPAYKFLFLEPFQEFEDTMLINEPVFDIGVTVTLEDTMAVGEDTLTVQSMTYNVGDVWRFNTLVTGEALATADGATVPNSGSPISLANTNLIGKDISGPSPLQEDVDYTMDYKAGEVTPKTVWPAGSYTIDYRNLVITAQASKDASLGDTDYVIGGQDPEKIRVRREFFTGGSITSEGVQAKALTAPQSPFTQSLHPGQFIDILEPLSHEGRYKIVRVIGNDKAVLDDPTLATVSNVIWKFPSEEPSDGTISGGSPQRTLTTASGMFLARHVGRYVRIADAANSVNNGRHRISIVTAPYQVTLENATGVNFVAEAGLHWRMEGSQLQMDLVERPLQIAVT
jgi:hypothetical protein